MSDSNERPTLGKVFDVLGELKTAVAVITDRITDLTDHEHRIRALERRSWSFAGVAAVGGAALSQIVTALFKGAS